MLCLRPLGLCGRGLLFLTPLALLAVGLVYLRMLYSPIAVPFLAGSIERALNAAVSPATIRIEGVALHRSERGGIELRLHKVRVEDSAGSHIAESAWAGVEINLGALAQGRIAASRIDLIEPRVIVREDANGRFSLQFQSRPEQDRGSAAPASSPRGGSDAPVLQGRSPTETKPQDEVDPARMLSQALRQMPASGGVPLDTVGLRNATVIVDTGTRRTTWHVPLLDLHLKQLPRRGVVTGSARIATDGDPWTIDFKAAAPNEQGIIGIDVNAASLVPAALASNLPNVAALDGLDVPVTARLHIDLGRDAELVKATLEADLGAGRWTPAWLGQPTALDGGRITADYEGARSRFVIAPSTLGIAGQRLLLAGTADPAGLPGAGTGWLLDMTAKPAATGDGASDAVAGWLQSFEMRARFGGMAGGMKVENARLASRGLEIAASGRLGGAGTEGDVDLTGRVSAISASSLKEVWPPGWAPEIRAAVTRAFTKGTISAKSFKIATGTERGARGGPGPLQLSLLLEGLGLEIETVAGLPPIEVPRALLKVEGSTVEASIPDAAIAASPARRIILKGGSAVLVQGEGSAQRVEFSGKIQGPLAAFLELAERDVIGLKSGLPLSSVDGKVESSFSVTMPVASKFDPATIRLESKTRITEGKLKDVLGPHDVTGASVTIDATERVIDAKGDLLVAGVNVKLAGQWLAQPPDGQQPPFKLTAKLDRAYRVQLGLDLEHMLAGETPIEITIQPVKGEAARVHFAADLTSAELSLHDLYWTKQTGRPARLDFDVVKGAAPKTMELQSFRLVGDDIAIDGSVSTGPDNRAREYNFPQFSLNVITNLSVRGKLRSDRVWEVIARGKTFDARDLFRSFYVFDGSTAPAAKNRPGIDLNAEIDTVIGANDTSLKQVRVLMQQRAEHMTALELTALQDGGKRLTAWLRPERGRPRTLHSTTDDAGQTMKVVGFYTNMVGGTGTLDVNLDGQGAAEKQGRVNIRRFSVLGDPIVSEVFQNADGTRPAIEPGSGGRRRIIREQFEFEQLDASVAVGNGQIAVEDAIVNGPLVGASLRGKIDFRSRRMQLGGTYIPLSGINRALSGVPVLGAILTGPRGEGVFGVTFAIQGSMAEPNVIANPLSMLSPGITREIFQMAPEAPRISPRVETFPRAKNGAQVRSSTPQQTDGPGSSRDQGSADGWSTTETKSKRKPQ